MDRPSSNAPAPGSRPMFRLALAVAGLAVLISALALVGVSASAAPEVIDATRSQVRELEAEVQGIDVRAAEAADAHAAALRRAQDLRGRIDQTTAALAEARRAHTVSVERLSDRLVALYSSEPPTLVEIVLSSGGLTEAVDAQRALEAVSAGDSRVVEQLARSRARLTALRAELVESRAGVEANVAASRERLGELQGLIQRRRAALAEARGTLDAMLAADERRRADAAQARAREAAAAAAETRAERALLRRADPETPAPTAAAASAPAAATGPTPTPTPAPSPAPSGVGSALDRIAQCESGGNPRAVSASGQYRGKYQFDPSTWASLGGSGDPAAAPEAEQDRIAALLYARSGPGPWPVCGYR